MILNLTYGDKRRVTLHVEGDVTLDEFARLTPIVAAIEQWACSEPAEHLSDEDLPVGVAMDADAVAAP